MQFRDFRVNPSITLSVALSVILSLSQTSYGVLNCDISTWNLETLQCFAVGEKGNYILDRIKQSDLADTMTTETFRKFDWGTIKSFQLKNAKLLKLSPDLFVNASALVNLDLSENPDLCFFGKEFMHLKRLQTLRLSGTGKCTEKSLLSNLPYLHSLDLSNARIRYEIFSLTNLNSFPGLRVVDLSRNHKYDIDFTKLNVGGVVKFVKVSQTKVKVGNRCFADATSLRTLIMSDSQIRSIPKDSFKGTAISHLDLSYNTITAAGLNSLTDSMIYVNVSHNKIDDVFRPGVFKEALETLDLSYNQMDHLHAESFSTTSKLRTLILAHNKFHWLYTKLLADLPALEVLDISYNVLYTFTESFFDDLKNLKTLNLAGNLISSLHNNMFQRNGRLENLYLQENRLESLNILTFIHLKQLRTLDLRNNKLYRLPDDLFQVSDLYVFLVSCNRLTYLSAGFFKGKLGTTVSLHGNPWKCACLSPIIGALETYDLQLDRRYFNDGSHPTCYVGEKNNTNRCNDNTLLPGDYANWETAVIKTGIKC